MEKVNRQELLKRRLIEEYSVYQESGRSPKHLVVAVSLPSGATEIISNTEQLESKIKYYIDVYDECFQLKANPNVRIINFMLI